RANRQVDGRLGAVNLEVPAVAGDVPVKLVVIVEKADLPVGDIGDDENVPAVIQQHVGIADLHALAVVDGIQFVLFVVVVHRHALHVESHAHAPAELVGVDGGEIAVDAVTDVVAPRVHRDGFHDIKLPVRLHGDVAGKIENAFDVVLRAGGRHQNKRCEERHNESGPAHQEKETFGTARSAALSISKNFAGVNPPMLAIRL